MLRPHPLLTPFPCSVRPRYPYASKPTFIPSPSSPPPQSQSLPNQEDRLQTALLYLARASAILPRTSAVAGRLYEFAAPNWSLERWEGEVERVWGGDGDGDARKGNEREMKSEMSGAGHWVRRAVGVLKREGEEGEYWRDGRDLEDMWGRVGGGL